MTLDTLDNGPAPGAWYTLRSEDSLPFLVLDFDDRTDLITLQYVDGTIEEIYLDWWEAWEPILTDMPHFQLSHPDDEELYLKTVDCITANLDVGTIGAISSNANAVNDSDSYYEMPENPAM
ncbi:MAG: hypothetical protein P8104_10600 [Gammaproteobacteria bacterium]